MNPNSLANLKKFQEGHLGYWKGKKRPPMSHEVKEKISSSLTGKKYKPMSDIGRTNIKLAQQGKKLSEEHKEKIGNSHKGRKLSKSWVKNIRRSKIGNKSHFWKGGITSKNKLLRNSCANKRWRKEVFERDDYTCQICGSKNGMGKTIFLNADHIKPFSLFPDLRFDTKMVGLFVETVMKRLIAMAVNVLEQRRNMRATGLNFVPRSYNFSEMSPELVNNLSQEQDQEDYDKEYSILKMLYCLKSDKERCILLFEILREYGYQFDYRSLAKSVHVELRWFMRVKEKMRKRIKQGLADHISNE